MLVSLMAAAGAPETPDKSGWGVQVGPGGGASGYCVPTDHNTTCPQKASRCLLTDWPDLLSLDMCWVVQVA